MQSSIYTAGEWNLGKDIDLSFQPRKTFCLFSQVDRLREVGISLEGRRELSLLGKPTKGLGFGTD